LEVSLRKLGEGRFDRKFRVEPRGTSACVAGETIPVKRLTTMAETACGVRRCRVLYWFDPPFMLV
jgi:hypothetical protein